MNSNILMSVTGQIYFSNILSYPNHYTNRPIYFKTMFDTTLLPYNKMYDNSTNTLCYTQSKNYIYKPHNNYGRVGTSTAGYIASRNRL